MTVRRGCTNRDDRGNTSNRAVRRQWLVNTFGDGEFVDCQLKAVDHCWVAMTKWTVSVDRKRPGALGGTYRRDNIQPACPPCQSHTGGKLGAALRAAKAAAA